MPAVFENEAEPQDPDKPEDLFTDESLQLSVMANRYNSDSLKDTQARGLGTANKLDTATVLGTLTEAQRKELWRRRAEDKERRFPQHLAQQKEFAMQVAIGAEMIKEDRKSRFSFVERPRPNNLRIKFKALGLYVTFQVALFALKVKRIFGKLFS